MSEEAFLLSIPGYIESVNKLDGVRPLDNRPSTDKLHHFVRKEKKKIKIKL